MKRTYYAVIPAYVRYDKNLTPNAKLMFGELTALSNDKGYCYASNKYFSQLYQVSTVSISKWINQLKEKKYIKVTFTYKNNSKEIESRNIYIRNIKEALKISLIPHKEKLKDNSNNNTITTITNNKEIIYNELIEKSFFHISNLFPLAVQPRTVVDIKNWKNCLDKLDRIDGYDTRAIYYIVKKVRSDDFWKENFFSILKLRKKNKDGIKYIDMFRAKFAKDYEFNTK